MRRKLPYMLYLFHSIFSVQCDIMICIYKAEFTFVKFLEEFNIAKSTVMYKSHG